MTMNDQKKPNTLIDAAMLMRACAGGINLTLEDKMKPEVLKRQLEAMRTQLGLRHAQPAGIGALVDASKAGG